MEPGPRERALSLRGAARIAGAAYLATNALVAFAELFVRARLVVAGDAARTADNIAAHAQLFRLGVVCDLAAFAGIVVLNWALYELLAPVHRSLARLAASWRLTEAALRGASAIGCLVVLSVLVGREAAKAFEPRQLVALARLALGAFFIGYRIALVFFGLGGTLYAFLLLRSRYVPAALAGFGVGASALLGLSVLAGILFPSLARGWATVYFALPVLLFEVTLGVWLLARGVRTRESAEFETRPAPSAATPLA